ncbi:MAG: helix-turn-helix transcriptional regulator [Clostridia bacterium]|nr:helix-turn-helix transcriptional regulator [Clostridia bacterium]
MTNFGERIYDLRNRNNMSQGDLADKLDVSRQTISKWENNMCMPEADKLIQLSEIFGVSTDYILKGITIVEPDPVYIYVKDPESENTSKYNEKIVRKYVGIVLAVVGVILSAWLAILGGWLFIIFTGALVLLGILFACDAKHPWLIVLWIAYSLSMIALPFCTAINPLLVFDPTIYTEDYLLPLLWAYAEWIILAILILCTVKAKRGYIFKKTQ